MEKNNKKIALLTLFNSNYGSFLQCFSTKSMLEKMGYECEILEIKKNNNPIIVFFKKIKKTIKCLFYPSYFRMTLNMRRSFKIDHMVLSLSSKKALNDLVFSEFHPISITYSDLNAKSKNNEYFAYIVGSDQVWNASRDISKHYFLRFADKNKRIAFGPSLGVSKIPRYNRYIKKYIKDFNFLSVREETAFNLLNEFCHNKINRVGDPTIMFDKFFWTRFYNTKNSLKPDYSYIFVHFINKPNKIAVSNILKFSEKYNYKVVCFGYYYDEFAIINNRIIIDGDARDYLYYIDNSSFIFTDSFHTSLFSINLEKNFYVFDRQYSHNYSQNSRISDMLKRYGYIDRFIHNENDIENVKSIIDDNCLENDRDITRDFLISSIKQINQ